MVYKRIAFISANALAAILATLFIYLADFERGRTSTIEQYLGISRRFSALVSGLSYAAPQNMDPVRWAIGLLDQGEEPRSMKISRTKISPEQAETETEKYAFNHQKSVFEFTKLVIPQDGSGIKISYKLPYRGFLGTKSRATSDLLIIVIFLGIFGLLALSTPKLFKEIEDDEIQPQNWAVEGKRLLVELSLTIRALLKNTEKIANQVKSSETRAEQLVTMPSNAEVQRKAEALVLNLILESNRLGSDGFRFRAKTEELHRTLRQIGRNAQRLENETSAMHGELTSCIKTIEGIDSDISKTSTAIQRQAKFIAKLRAS